MNDDTVDTFDPAALLANLTVEQLLAVQETAETALADAALACHDDNTVLDVLESREQLGRRREVFNAKLFAEISDRTLYRTAGYLSIHSLYEQGLRLGAGETRRRKTTAAAIGRLTAMTGEQLRPALPETEAAVADGSIGREHVTVIADIMDRIPHSIDDEQRVKAEAMLADAARNLPPEAVVTVGNRILSWLNPDGDATDQRDRARRRTFVIQPQNRELMSKVRAQLTPTLRAKLEVVLYQWAQPGMNNPDDPESPKGAADQPGLDHTVLAAAAERDDRSIGQRQHDALEAVCEWALALAGQSAPERIPSQVVFTMTDEDLARHAGIGWTATGTRIPIGDLIRMAAHATPYLAVFSKATGEPLYLGRGERCASLAQRLAVFARDRGCTAPGCNAPFVRTQIHHMPDWKDGCPTDIDHLGGACGGHNRWVGPQPGQWETKILTEGPDAGRVGWRRAGRDGPWQVNNLQHPEKFRDGQDPPNLAGMNAPPTDETGSPPTDSTESRIEAFLQQRLAA